MAEPGSSNGPARGRRSGEGAQTDARAEPARPGDGAAKSAPSSTNGFVRDLAERLVLGGVGALALTADRVDGLVDALVSRGGMERDDARTLVDDLTGRWRAEAKRVAHASSTAQGLLRELGLVTKADLEELELRIAQLEHRLRLVEGAKPPAS
jgi:polyhydroxyalkanoate synthesis regulator phasin